MQCSIFRDSEKNIAALSEILYLGKYHSLHAGNNPHFDAFTALVLRIKYSHPSEKDIRYFTDQLRYILSNTEKYVICVVPRHAFGIAPSGIRKIAKRLCIPPIVDGTNVLVRSREIQQKSAGGNRDMKLEIESLTVKNESIIKDQQVLLLDDVTTSGTSLRVGKCVLESAGAKLVAMFALGQTQLE